MPTILTKTIVIPYYGSKNDVRKLPDAITIAKFTVIECLDKVNFNVS